MPRGDNARIPIITVPRNITSSPVTNLAPCPSWGYRCPSAAFEGFPLLPWGVNHEKRTGPVLGNAIGDAPRCPPGELGSPEVRRHEEEGSSGRSLFVRPCTLGLFR